MKPKYSRRSGFLPLVTAITLALGTGFSNAATFYWDGTSPVATGGFGTAGGTWTQNNTSGFNWTTSATGVLAGNSAQVTATTDAFNFGTATLGVGAGTVTVAGAGVTMGNLTYGAASGAIVLSGGPITLAAAETIAVNNSTDTISSNLAGAATSLTKNGAGSLFLSGSNSYAGQTIISAGTLVHNSANAIPGGMATGGSGVQISINGGVLGLGVTDFTRTATTTAGTAGTIRFASNGGWAAYGADRIVNVGGAGATVGIGSGTFTGVFNGKSLIFGAADATHKVTFVNGLDMGTVTRTIQVNDGPAAVELELSGVVLSNTAGAGMNKTGAGTMLLSNANTFPGNLNLNAGRVMVGNPSALGASSAGTIVANGAALDLNGTNMTIGNALTLSGTGISSGGSLTNSSSTAGTFAGPVTFGNATVRIGGTGAISLSNASAITGTDSSLTLAGAGGTLAGGLQTGAGTLTANSSGSWSLYGTNTYTGATSVNGGTLSLVGTASMNSSSSITVNGSGTKLLQTSSVAVTPPVTLTQGTVTGSGTINSVDVGAGTGGIISNNNGVAGASLTIGTLNFNGGATINAFVTGTTAPIATTSLSTNAAGTVTINASSPVWSDNTAHPLVSYGGGSVGGAGSSQFVLGTVSGLSARQVASPTLGDSGTAITLTISGDTPYWTGDGDDTWNLSSTNNWALISDNSPTLFLTNDNVLFNDSATGAGPITVDIDAANVAPNSTVFNNITKNYVLGSTGGFGISTGALIKNGAGTLTINNANTYPGGTNLNGGTLQLGNVNAIGTSVLTISGGNLDSSVANLVNAGNNTQLWNSDFTFVGTESLNLGTGAVTLGGNRTVTVSAGNLTIGGSIGGGAVDLTKQGAGTLTLAGGGTFTGTLTISAGNLALKPATSGAFTLSNSLSGSAVLSVNPFAANSSNLSLVGDLSGFTGTVNVATSGGFNSKLATTGASSSFGAGAVVNIADGGTWYSTVNQTGISVNIFGMGNSESLGAFRLDGGTLDSTSSVVLKADGSLGTTGSSIINAPVSEVGGSFALTKQGTGTMFLGGTNSYSGLTTVSAGLLVLQNASALGSTTGGTIVTNGTRVELDGLTVTGEALTVAGAGGDNLGALKGRSGASVWNGPVTVDADLTRIGVVTGASLEVSGVIDDGVNDYRVIFRPQSATGTVIVSGANTYTGGTTIMGGPVVASSLNKVVGGTATSNFGAPVDAANGMLIIGNFNAGGTLSYNGTGETTDRTVQIGGNTSPTPIAGDTGSAEIDNNGTSGALVFNAPNFNSPTNALTGTSPTRTLTLGGTNASNNTISGIIQNNQIASASTAAVAVTKTGTGIWILAGQNTYTGLTTVSDGMLNLTGNRIADSGAITVQSGGILSISNGNFSLGANTFTLGAVSGTSTVNHTAGSISFSGGTQLLVGNGSTNGIYNLSGGTLTTAAVANRGIILGVNIGCMGTFNLSDSGTLSMASGSYLEIGRHDSTGVTGSTGIFNQTGATSTATIGTLSMGGGIATNSGTTAQLNLSAGTFSASGFVALSLGDTSTSTINISGTADVTLPALPTARGSGSTATITFDGGTLRPAGPSATYLGGAAGTSALIKSGGAKFDVAASNDITISTPLLTDGVSLGGGMIKTGPASLTLTGANTYTGATTVQNGTLALVGGSQASPITVSSGASLGFTLESPTTSTSSFNLTLGTIKITGTPTLPSYTLITSSTGITGTPTLDSPISGYELQVSGNALNLVQTSTPYSLWAAAKGLNNLDAAHSSAKDADPDGDGVNNLAEFAFNGDPLSGSNNGLHASLLQDTIAPATDELTYIVAVRDGATFGTSGLVQTNSVAVDGLYYTVEGSIDLVFPGSAVSYVSSSKTAPVATGLPDLTATAWTYYTFRLDASEGLGGKGFMRAKVSDTP